MNRPSIPIVSFSVNFLALKSELVDADANGIAYAYGHPAAGEDGRSLRIGRNLPPPSGLTLTFASPV